VAENRQVAWTVRGDDDGVPLAPAASTIQLTAPSHPPHTPQVQFVSQSSMPRSDIVRYHGSGYGRERSRGCSRCGTVGSILLFVLGLPLVLYVLADRTGGFSSGTHLSVLVYESTLGKSSMRHAAYGGVCLEL
jgi:hypothetical protein